MSEVVLQLIEKSGSAGLTEKELQTQTGKPRTVIRKILIRMRVKGLVYWSLSENKWRLVRYQREDEKEYNKRMEWSAG